MVTSDPAGGTCHRDVFWGLTPPEGAREEPLTSLPQLLSWPKNYSLILKARVSYTTCFLESVPFARGEACLQKFSRGKGNQPERGKIRVRTATLIHAPAVPPGTAFFWNSLLYVGHS